jgi:hypothetical protein
VRFDGTAFHVYTAADGRERSGHAFAPPRRPRNSVRTHSTWIVVAHSGSRHACACSGPYQDGSRNGPGHRQPPPGPSTRTAEARCGLASTEEGLPDSTPMAGCHCRRRTV